MKRVSQAFTPRPNRLATLTPVDPTNAGFQATLPSASDVLGTHAGDRSKISLRCEWGKFAISHRRDEYCAQISADAVMIADSPPLEVAIKFCRYRGQLFFRLLIVVLLGASEVKSENRDRLFGESDDHPLNVLWNDVLILASPEALFIGRGELRKTLHGERHENLLLLLDDILERPDVVQQQSPLARLVIQRQTWAFFDWLASEMPTVWHTADQTRDWPIHVVGKGSPEANRAVRIRLAALIRCAAITEDEIAQLPSNYTSAPLHDPEQTVSAINDLDLPEELFAPDGPWMQIVYKHGGRIGVAHESARGTRSEVLLFVRFPESRSEGEAFIELFNQHAKWASRHRFPTIRPPEKPTVGRPVVPVGTRLILVSRMLAVLTSGDVVPTPVIESVEFNEARRTAVRNPYEVSEMKHAAFALSLERLVAGDEPSLRRTNPGEPFLGVEPMPLGVTNCRKCHQQSTDVLSLSNVGFAHHQDRPQDLSWRVVPNGTSPRTAVRKMYSFKYGLLRGLIDQLNEQAGE